MYGITGEKDEQQIGIKGNIASHGGNNDMCNDRLRQKRRLGGR